MSSPHFVLILSSELQLHCDVGSLVGVLLGDVVVGELLGDVVVGELLGDVVVGATVGGLVAAALQPKWPSSWPSVHFALQ